MPRGISALSLHNLHSQYRGPMIFNEEGAGGDNADDAKAKADAAAKADADAKAKADAEAKGKGDNSAEERVKKALEKAKAAEERAAALEAADKKRLDEEAKAKGEHEKLLNERETELATLRGEHESKSKTLEEYEKTAKAQVEKKLEAIKDEKKKASILKLLEGHSVLKQFELVDEAISIAGGSSDFGGNTPPSDATEAKATKQKRYNELLNKADCTPSEQAEMHKLMVELSEYTNADKGAF